MLMRPLHRWPGLVLAALLFVTALSGAALSLFPALEAEQAPTVSDTLTVAELATRVQASHPGLEQIKRAPSGRITAWWFDGEQPGSAVIDPATGRDVASADPNPTQRWLTTLHRSLFLGDGGRLVAAAGALTMLLLAITGAWLVARRTGGWHRWFTRLRGPWAGRLHTEIARVAVLGLLLSAVTALWMSAETFEVITVESANLNTPATVSGQTGRPLAQMDALRATPVAALRDLSFPAAGDPQDVFTLRTTQGMGYVDAGTGTLLAWQDLSLSQRVSDTMEMLHTGRGAAVLGLILGVMALGVPVLSVTGVLVWLAGWRTRPKLSGNAPAAQADTVVLVGSESGSTWGFATTLAEALRRAGQSVHIAPMSGFAPARYRQAQRYLILAATYGEGDAPASAQGFLARLQALDAPPTAPLAVLGFGDRSFPAFCAFAAAVTDAAHTKGWPTLLPFDTIDRQSPQDFARWGRALGEALGTPLELAHQPTLPATEMLTLVARQDYGSAVQVPMSILRFALPPTSRWQRLTGQGFTRFEPGDLLGIVPEGSPVPRLYSLASGARDGFIEIVVRRHVGGLVSTQLTELEPGQTVRAFVRPHPGFHADRGRTPLILIGAGTGVGPLAGFIRDNTAGRPIHLFFGLRHPDSDFLYHSEWSRWQAEGKLTELSLAVSRSAQPQYVQDALRQAAPQVVDAIRHGAKVMVCGGRDMARGVSEALTEILQPAGLTPAMLKAGDRYVEDVY
ncbi:PepSY domain-containing protein [Aquabacterium sp. G14]|uniref:PepSY domain-containing protein n=1 Tax=Aquabacterium sp. G14 TaxID=3130164 RepID=UPI0030A5BA73